MQPAGRRLTRKAGKPPGALALAIGHGLDRATGLSERDCRAVAFETGIQNSGLGLVLVFNFFGGLGGMAIVTAWWGIWHIMAGMALSTFWMRRPPPQPQTEDS